MKKMIFLFVGLLFASSFFVVGCEDEGSTGDPFPNDMIPSDQNPGDGNPGPIEEEMDDEPEEEMDDEPEEEKPKTRQELLDEGWAVRKFSREKAHIDDVRCNLCSYDYKLYGRLGTVTVIYDNDPYSPFYDPNVVLTQYWTSAASIWVSDQRELYKDGTWSSNWWAHDSDQVPGNQFFCRNYQFISENLDSEERESFNVCFEVGTPGAPFEDQPGILWNSICYPGDVCVFGCFSYLLLASQLTEDVKRQIQITEEDNNGNRYNRCREQSSVGTWESWTDWYLF